MLQSGIQNGWGELMPINIIKIWCRNNRSVMSQPIFNDCFVNKTIMNLCTWFCWLFPKYMLFWYKQVGLKSLVCIWFKYDYIRLIFRKNHVVVGSIWCIICHIQAYLDEIMCKPGLFGVMVATRLFYIWVSECSKYRYNSRRFRIWWTRKSICCEYRGDYSLRVLCVLTLTFEMWMYRIFAEHRGTSITVPSHSTIHRKSTDTHRWTFS